MNLLRAPAAYQQELEALRASREVDDFSDQDDLEVVFSQAEANLLATYFKEA